MNAFRTAVAGVKTYAICLVSFLLSSLLSPAFASLRRGKPVIPKLAAP